MEVMVVMVVMRSMEIQGKVRKVVVLLVGMEV